MFVCVQLSKTRETVRLPHVIWISSLLPLAPTCFRRPASLYVGRLLYVVELLGSRRHRVPQAAYLREVPLRAANARTATAATDVRTEAMCT